LRSFWFSEGFLSSGLTRADLNIEGKDPDERELLMTEVIEGRRTSKHSINNGVGNGSRSQVVGVA
jgi:hypothetical protein